MTKKLLSFLLALFIIVAAVPSAVYATESPDGNALSDTSSMDALDILIATYRVLAATADDENSAWDKITGITSIEPLYDLDGKVVAFYLTFEPAGYVVVNNNLLNPVIMEYSPVNYPEMDQLVLKTSTKDENGDAFDFICYGGALNCFTYDDAIEYMDQSKAEEKDYKKLLHLEDLYTFMKTENISEYCLQKELRSYVEENQKVSSTKSSYTTEELKEIYEIIDWEDMPSGSYTPGHLSGCGMVDYGTTGEFYGINGANNHCAATAAFNVVAYYSYYLEEDDLYVNNDNEDTFTAIHANIGNGPVLFPGYNSGLEDYVNDRGYTYHYSVGGNYSAIKNGIDSNHMSTVLMYGSLLNWHMVNAVGYREYASGTNYIRIVDGWESTSQRFIISTNMVGSYTTWIS